MKKLRLVAEDLRVDSFATDLRADARAGSVQAHAASDPFATCAGATCKQDTCAATQCDISACIDSCGQTCQITCGDCITFDVC